MSAIDKSRWLPYMSQWYHQKYEFLPTPYVKVGKLKPEILSVLLSEIVETNYTKLPDTYIEYYGYGLFTPDGNKNSWWMRQRPTEVGKKHSGFIKSVQNLQPVKCTDVTSTETYLLLNSFGDVRRAHYAKLMGTSGISIHADNPHQEGLRFQINLNGGENTLYSFGGAEFRIYPGEIYWLNTGLEHFVQNESIQPRTSIVVDVAFSGNLTAQLDQVKNNLQNNNYLIS